MDHAVVAVATTVTVLGFAVCRAAILRCTVHFVCYQTPGAVSPAARACTVQWSTGCCRWTAVCPGCEHGVSDSWPPPLRSLAALCSLEREVSNLLLWAGMYAPVYSCTCFLREVYIHAFLEPLPPSGAKRLYVETVLPLVGSASRREAPSLEPLPPSGAKRLCRDGPLPT